MFTHGITGSIASGKSTVCAFLAQYWPVIDADQTSREVVAPGQPGLDDLVAAFGPEILLPDGQLDRAEMRRRIALSKDAQQTINGILHPRILQRIHAQLDELKEQGLDHAFVAAALMMESGSYKNYGDVILVSAPWEARLRRVLARDGMDEATALALMSKQMPDDEKRQRATVEIVNDSDVASLETKTWAVLATIGIHRPNPLP